MTLWDENSGAVRWQICQSCIQLKSLDGQLSALPAYTAPTNVSFDGRCRPSPRCHFRRTRRTTPSENPPGRRVSKSDRRMAGPTGRNLIRTGYKGGWRRTRVGWNGGCQSKRSPPIRLTTQPHPSSSGEGAVAPLHNGGIGCPCFSRENLPKNQTEIGVDILFCPSYLGQISLLSTRSV